MSLLCQDKLQHCQVYYELLETRISASLTHYCQMFYDPKWSCRPIRASALTEGRNSSPCGRNALFCIWRYQCALSGIGFSISNISVDAVVDRYVSSGISGAQRHESEFLRELTSIRDRVLVCQLFSARVILRHLSSMFVFLSFSVFVFLLR